MTMPPGEGKFLPFVKPIGNNIYALDAHFRHGAPFFSIHDFEGKIKPSLLFIAAHLAILTPFTLSEGRAEITAASGIDKAEAISDVVMRVLSSDLTACI